jgi:hypothetical protein
MKAERGAQITVSAAQRADAGVLWAGLDRGELRKQFDGGTLYELEFEAVVFRVEYPNWNYVRFRDEELAACRFCATSSRRR